MASQEPLIPGLEPLGQARLFDPPNRSRRPKAAVDCPSCGGHFEVHPSVARVFRRCSACREAGIEALEIPVG